MVCRGSPAMHGYFLKRLQSYVLFGNKANSWYLIFQNISSADISQAYLIKTKRCATFVC